MKTTILTLSLLAGAAFGQGRGTVTIQAPKSSSSTITLRSFSEVAPGGRVTQQAVWGLPSGSVVVHEDGTVAIPAGADPLKIIAEITEEAAKEMLKNQKEVQNCNTLLRNFVQEISEANKTLDKINSQLDKKDKK